MRLITRFTDSLVDRLAPKAVVRASCEPDTVCGGCFNGRKSCCAVRQDCTRSCYDTVC